jgi:hypothetical protein
VQLPNFEHDHIPHLADVAPRRSAQASSAVARHWSPLVNTAELHANRTMRHSTTSGGWAIPLPSHTRIHNSNASKAPCPTVKCTTRQTQIHAKHSLPAEVADTQTKSTWLCPEAAGMQRVVVAATSSHMYNAEKLLPCITPAPDHATHLAPSGKATMHL